jgi:hypothetical protein
MYHEGVCAYQWPIDNGLTGHGNTRLSICTGSLMSCLFSLFLKRFSAGGDNYQQVNHD